MTQQTGVGDAHSQQGSTGGSGTRLERETQDARAAARELGDDVKEKAGKFASDAKAAAGEKVEEAQHGIGAGLKSIGGAFRAAGDHLSGEHQTTASRIAKEAASGIDRLSETLQNRPVNEVVGELRDFGRRNAGGLFAGSLLAGLALGRLIKLSAKAGQSEDASRDPSSTGRTPDHGDSATSSGDKVGSAHLGASHAGSSHAGAAGGGLHDRASTGSTGGVAGSTGANTAGSAGAGRVGAPVSDPARPAVGREPAAGSQAVGNAGIRPGVTGTERPS